MKNRILRLVIIGFSLFFIQRDLYAQRIKVPKSSKTTVSSKKGSGKLVKPTNKQKITNTSKPFVNVNPKKKLTYNKINNKKKTKNKGKIVSSKENLSEGKLKKNNEKPRVVKSSFNSIQRKQLEINKSLAKKKGNWTLPFKSSETEANRLGISYVGPKYKRSKNGNALISHDGLKQYRKPEFKPKENLYRANFQRGIKNNSGKTNWISNAHLDIKIR